jgi:glycosyltransferase involved in cell wall biosynthesis
VNDRGGLQYAIRAFVEEFDKEEKVKFLVKINKVYNPNFNVSAAIESLNLEKPKIKRPMLLITEQFIPQKQMIEEIYQQGDVFVSSTRGEAFNLPCLEAMSCGLPCIVTDFGGQKDFIDKDNGWLTSYKLEKPTDISYEETLWATPDITTLRKAMRDAFTNEKKTALKAKIALDTVEHFTWKNTARKIIALIQD